MTKAATPKKAKASKAKAPAKGKAPAKRKAAPKVKAASAVSSPSPALAPAPTVILTASEVPADIQAALGFKETPANKPMQGRDEKGRLLPGTSGNPTGRPRVAARIKEIAREHTDVCMRVLVEIAQNAAETGSARVSAVNTLLGYGYGKPIQQVEVGNPGDFSNMDEDEIDSFIAKASMELAIFASAGSVGAGALH